MRERDIIDPPDVFGEPIITGLPFKRLGSAPRLILYLMGEKNYSGHMTLLCKLSLQRAVENSIGKTSR